MYAICNVIYGIPLNSNDYNDEVEKSDTLQDLLYEEEPGFYEFYSGVGDESPQAFGVLLDTFDECAHHTFLNSLQLSPTDAQRAQYDELFNSLDPVLQQELRNIAQEPCTFILWSTS